MKLYASSIAKEQKQKDKILCKRREFYNTVSQLEYEIIENYDISRFEKAPLYKWLESIDKEYEEKNKESV